ncbi:MAG: hypothetical protein PHY12_06345, partial [Eubacteriales bacterium]|nr:hypothetical protein [Eubacteriales bacterium]
MKKQGLAILLILTLMLSVLPGASLAAAKQMNDGVPVWNEETVKDYATKYIHGLNYETLWGYYDLQIRRYMPMETYTTMLSDIEFLTGKFIEFGTYTSFEEPEQKTKTHVLHLCMEKQDLDMYFTHKNKEDDWEVMAVEFALAQEQDVSDHSDMLVTDAQAEPEAAGDTVPEAAGYTELEVTVGLAPYELSGTLTLPAGASAEAKVPAVVLVHGSGPSDRNETIGQTAMFADIAAYFAGSGIASIRYDKRTFVYGAAMTQDEINALTVEEETIQDAISAGRLLEQN